MMPPCLTAACLPGWSSEVRSSLFDAGLSFFPTSLRPSRAPTPTCLSLPGPLPLPLSLPRWLLISKSANGGAEGGCARSPLPPCVRASDPLSPSPPLPPAIIKAFRPLYIEEARGGGGDPANGRPARRRAGREGDLILLDMTVGGASVPPRSLSAAQFPRKGMTRRAAASCSSPNFRSLQNL